jgi:hypothetical protein
MPKQKIPNNIGETSGRERFRQVMQLGFASSARFEPAH